MPLLVVIIRFMTGRILRFYRFYYEGIANMSKVSTLKLTGYSTLLDETLLLNPDKLNLI
jgi:hypothetical protein